MIAQRTLINSTYRFNGIRTLSSLNVSMNITVNHDRSKRRADTNSSPSLRLIHTSTVTHKNPTTIILSLSAIAATAKAGQYMIQAYEQWKLSQPEKPPIQSEPEESSAGKEPNESTKTDSRKREEDGKRENIFQTLFGIGVGSKYYEGGFEEKMTRREAALILGVRETSTTKRIKEAHRKLLVLNHPDTGGSTYLAGKINEAKELLMKGRREQ
jgi:hypothetical protein